VAILFQDCGLGSFQHASPTTDSSFFTGTLDRANSCINMIDLGSYYV